MITEGPVPREGCRVKGRVHRWRPALGKRGSEPLRAPTLRSDPGDSGQVEDHRDEQEGCGKPGLPYRGAHAQGLAPKAGVKKIH